MAVTELGQTAGLAWARSAHSSFTNSPLAELQEWQGGSKAPAIPVSLEATTGPGWKSSYNVGEKLSLDGLVLTIHYSDGSKQSYSKPFNGEFSFSPSEGTEINKPTAITCVWIKKEYYLNTNIIITCSGFSLQGIIVEGPTRTAYALGEKLSLDGLVVKAEWGPSETPIPEKLGGVTDGYTMALLVDRYNKTPFTSETIPAALNEPSAHGLEISYRDYKEYVTLKWMNPQPAITKITLSEFVTPVEWHPAQEPPYAPECPLTAIPNVNVTLENGTEKPSFNIDALIDLALPRLVFVEARYEGLENTIVVTAAHNTSTHKPQTIEGIVEGHKINAYRYLYGTTQATAAPVSEWLSITPPEM